MVDPLTQLENKLDQRYEERREALAVAGFVPDWQDVCFRHGYLQCIRDIGQMIKEVRNPELPKETGEIPSILDEVLHG